MIEANAEWIDQTARVLARAGPPACEVCDRPGAYQATVGAARWWICGGHVCRTLLSHVRTLGDLAQARRAYREAA